MSSGQKCFLYLHKGFIRIADAAQCNKCKAYYHQSSAPWEPHLSEMGRLRTAAWPWISRQTRLLRMGSHPQCRKRSNSLIDYIKFKKLRAKCIRLSRCAYKEYIARTELNIKLNVKSFWSFVKKLKSDNYIPVGMHLDGFMPIISSKYFGSVYSSGVLDAVAPVECHRILETIEISEADVYKVVRELDCNTNPGRKVSLRRL